MSGNLDLQVVSQKMSGNRREMSGNRREMSGNVRTRTRTTFQLSVLFRIERFWMK